MYFGLNTRWESFRRLAAFPLRSAFERFDGPRFVDVDHGIELLRDACVEIMALPLGLRPVNDPDRPFKQRFL